MTGFAREYLEKRNFIRMQINSPALLKLDSGEQLQVMCVDLSSDGAQLEGDKSVPLDSQGTLSINSGGGSTANLVARVRVKRVQASADSQYQIGVSIDQYL